MAGGWWWWRLCTHCVLHKPSKHFLKRSSVDLCNNLNLLHATDARHLWRHKVRFLPRHHHLLLAVRHPGIFHIGLRRGLNLCHVAAGTGSQHHFRSDNDTLKTWFNHLFAVSLHCNVSVPQIGARVCARVATLSPVEPAALFTQSASRASRLRITGCRGNQYALGSDSLRTATSTKWSQGSVLLSKK